MNALAQLAFAFGSSLPLADFVYVGGALGLVIAVLDIIAIVSVLGEGGSVLRKLAWILLILVLPFAGMLLYFIFGRGGSPA